MKQLKQNNIDYTDLQYGNFQKVFDYFNQKLFDNQLPFVLLTFNRKANSKGYFAANFWQYNAQASVHEISLNPDTLHRDFKLVCSTIVHEQVHLWQHTFGKKRSRSGYHNQEFSDKMQSVGLQTSDTGEPGGNSVGQRMTHYIIAGGIFEQAFNGMPTFISLPCKGVIKQHQAKEKPRSKVKYTCPGCGLNVWGKPQLEINCSPCRKQLLEDTEDAKFISSVKEGNATLEQF